MILVEQLRDYQIRSQHIRMFCVVSTFPLFDMLSNPLCQPSSYFLSPNLHLSNWADVAVVVFYTLLFGVLILSSYVALYLQHYWSSFLIISLAITLPGRLRMLRQAHARKKMGYALRITLDDPFIKKHDKTIN